MRDLCLVARWQDEQWRRVTVIPHEGHSWKIWVHPGVQLWTVATAGEWLTGFWINGLLVTDTCVPHWVGAYWDTEHINREWNE